MMAKSKSKPDRHPICLALQGGGCGGEEEQVAGDGERQHGSQREAQPAEEARLPRIAIQKPDRVIGKDTVGAMQSGVFWGYIALIEGLVDRIKAEWGAPLTVIGTGGVASLFDGATDRIDRFDPDLTIRGLLEIWRRNSH